MTQNLKHKNSYVNKNTVIKNILLYTMGEGNILIRVSIKLYISDEWCIIQS